MIKTTNAMTLAAIAAVTFVACGSANTDMARDETVQGPASEIRKGEGVVAARAVMVFADENKDGKVTRDEAKRDKALLASFERYDANDNKELDRAEFSRLEDDAYERREELAAAEIREQALRPRMEYPRPTDLSTD